MYTTIVAQQIDNRNTNPPRNSEGLCQNPELWYNPPKSEGITGFFKKSYIKAEITTLQALVNLCQCSYIQFAQDGKICALFVDFDNDGVDAVSAIFEEKFPGINYVAYPSRSSKAGNEKSHLIIPLESQQDATAVRLVLLSLLNYVFPTGDKSRIDPAPLVFGTDKPPSEYRYKIDGENFNVSAIYCQELTQKWDVAELENLSISQLSNIESAFLRLLGKHPKQDTTFSSESTPYKDSIAISKAIGSVDSDDPSLVFNRYPHNFRERNAKEANCRQWDGDDPLFASTSGKSFTVTLDYAGLWRWYSRNQAIGGLLNTYYVAMDYGSYSAINLQGDEARDRYRKLICELTKGARYGKVKVAVADKTKVAVADKTANTNGSLNKGASNGNVIGLQNLAEPDDAVMSLTRSKKESRQQEASKFDINADELTGASKILYTIDAYLDGQLRDKYHIKIFDSQYIIWDSQRAIWIKKTLKDSEFAGWLKHLLLNSKFSKLVYFGLVTDFIDRNLPGIYRSRYASTDPDLIIPYTRGICAFRDGVYNTDSQVFTSYKSDGFDPTVNIFFRKREFDFIKKSDVNIESVKKFTTLFKALLATPDQLQMQNVDNDVYSQNQLKILILWLSGVLRSHTGFTQYIPFFYGVGGAGKSTFVNVLRGILGDMKSLQASDLETSFLGSIIDHDINKFFIDDMTSMTAKAVFKNLTGNGDELRKVNVKYGGYVNIKSLNYFIAANEYLPYEFRSIADNGYQRRIVSFPVKGGQAYHDLLTQFFLPSIPDFKYMCHELACYFMQIKLDYNELLSTMRSTKEVVDYDLKYMERIQGHNTSCFIVDKLTLAKPKDISAGRNNVYSMHDLYKVWHLYTTNHGLKAASYYVFLEDFKLCFQEIYRRQFKKDYKDEALFSYNSHNTPTSAMLLGIVSCSA